MDMAYIVMAGIVKAHVVMADLVMAPARYLLLMKYLQEESAKESVKSWAVTKMLP